MLWQVSWREETRRGAFPVLRQKHATQRRTAGMGASGSGADLVQAHPRHRTMDQTGNCCSGPETGSITLPIPSITPPTWNGFHHSPAVQSPRIHVLTRCAVSSRGIIPRRNCVRKPWLPRCDDRYRHRVPPGRSGCSRILTRNDKRRNPEAA